MWVRALALSLFFIPSAQAACVYTGSAWAYVSCIYDEVVVAQGDIDDLRHQEIALVYSDVYETHTVSGDSYERSLYFDKSQADTALWVTYSEHFECQSFCDLQVRFDGEPCTVPGPIRLERGGVDGGITSTISGACTETRFGPIEAGSVHVGVYAEGWGIGTIWMTSPGILQVQEVTLR